MQHTPYTRLPAVIMAMYMATAGKEANCCGSMMIQGGRVVGGELGEPVLGHLGAHHDHFHCEWRRCEHQTNISKQRVATNRASLG